MMRILFFFLIIATSSNCNADDWRELANNQYGSSTVIISIPQPMDIEGKDVKYRWGSGFLISKQGHIATARHVIEDWQNLHHEIKRKHPLIVKFGNSLAAKEYEVNVFKSSTENEAVDFAILLTKEPPSANLKPGPLCLSSPHIPGPLYQAYGFPWPGSHFSERFPDDYNRAIQHVTIHPNLLGSGIWLANSAFSNGMSGGPIFSPKGIIGYVLGGDGNNHALRRVVPLNKVDHYLYQFHLPLVSGDCEEVFKPVVTHAVRRHGPDNDCLQFVFSNLPDDFKLGDIELEIVDTPVITTENSYASEPSFSCEVSQSIDPSELLLGNLKKLRFSVRFESENDKDVAYVDYCPQLNATGYAATFRVKPHFYAPAQSMPRNDLIVRGVSKDGTVQLNIRRPPNGNYTPVQEISNQYYPKCRRGNIQ